MKYGRWERGEAVNSSAGMCGLSPGDIESIDSPSYGIQSVNGRSSCREAGGHPLCCQKSLGDQGQEALSPREPPDNRGPQPHKRWKTYQLVYFCILLLWMNDQGSQPHTPGTKKLRFLGDFGQGQRHLLAGRTIHSFRRLRSCCQGAGIKQTSLG